MNKYVLDSLYNHKMICETLLKSGYTAAVTLFHQRASCLHEQPEDEQPVLRCIYLTSLNKSLYNFILFAWDLSLAECCYENTAYSHHYRDETFFLEAGEKIILSYSHLICAAGPQTSYIEKACDYIKNNLDQELTLEIVAQNIYISNSYLSQHFKNITGQKFSEYVSNQRIILARNLLLTTELKIDEIAQKCGFLSSTYFSTVFKKRTQFTPSHFRKCFAGISQYQSIK
mgnify:CR=1 FL=1